MSIPQIIHFTIPERPTSEQLKNIQLARDLHPGWQVVVWQDPIDPASFVLAKYWKKSNSGAQLADMIRLEVVYQQGGFYLDSDFRIQRNLEPLRAFPFVVASEDGKVLTNAFFGAESNNPALKQLIDTLDQNEPDWELSPVFTTGPSLFAQCLQWRGDVTIVPRETFYPHNWDESPKAARLWTYASHEWEHSWKPADSTPRWRQWISAENLRRPFLSAQFHSVRLIRQFIKRVRLAFHMNPPAPYNASGILCAQTLNGPKIYLVGEDISVTPQIALSGTYEYYEERLIQRVVRPGDWVIDVGANVGMMSLLFAQSVGPFGRVFSYEPNPLPASLLRKSLVMNWWHDRVVVRQKGVGSQPGKLKLRFNREVLGGATLAPQGAVGTFENNTAMLAEESEVEVEVVTLDAEFPVNLAVRMLKIDVEGFEHHVLQGASRLLREHCVDILMLECIQEVYGPNWPQYLAEIKKIIGLGYGLYTLSRKHKLQPLPFNQLPSADRSRNIFLVSNFAKDSIRELA